MARGNGEEGSEPRKTGEGAPTSAAKTDPEGGGGGGGQEEATCLCVFTKHGDEELCRQEESQDVHRLAEGTGLVV